MRNHKTQTVLALVALVLLMPVALPVVTTEARAGNLGTITAGTLTAITINGGSITGGTISGTTITGGSININSGAFVVNSSGGMSAATGTVDALTTNGILLQHPSVWSIQVTALAGGGNNRHLCVNNAGAFYAGSPGC